MIRFHTDIPSPIFWRRYVCMKIRKLVLEVCFWPRVMYSTVLSRTAAKPRALLCNELRKGTFFLFTWQRKAFSLGWSEGAEMKPWEVSSPAPPHSHTVDLCKGRPVPPRSCLWTPVSGLLSGLAIKETSSGFFTKRKNLHYVYMKES